MLSKYLKRIPRLFILTLLVVSLVLPAIPIVVSSGEAYASTDVTLRADSAGDYTQIANVTGATYHWQAVSDSSDSSYIWEGNTGSTYQAEVHNLGASGIPGGSVINSVTVYNRIRFDNAGGGWSKVILRLGSSETLGTELTHNHTGFANDSEVLARPGGGSWAVSDIDSLQAGISFKTAGNWNGIVAEVWVVVNYDAGVSTPTVNTVAASSLGNTYATINGKVTNSNGSTVSGRFQWGTTTGYGTDTDWQTGLTQDDTFYSSLTGLTSNQLYHFRAQIKDSGGTTYNGSDLTFTPTSVPVSAILRPESAGLFTTIPFATSGTHWSIMKDQDLNTKVWIYTGTGQDYYNLDLGSIPGGSDISSVTVSSYINIDQTSGGWWTLGVYTPTGGVVWGSQTSKNTLGWETKTWTATRPGGGSWTYDDIVDLQVCIKLDGTNKANLFSGDIWVTVVYTPSVTVAVSTLSATAVTETQAYLSGLVTNSMGNSVWGRFQWGTSLGYGTDTTWQKGIIQSDTFGQNISSLTSGVTYYYRAQINSSGTIYSGPGKTFVAAAATSLDNTVHSGTLWTDSGASTGESKTARAPDGTLWVVYAIDPPSNTGTIAVAHSNDGGTTWIEEVVDYGGSEGTKSGRGYPSIAVDSASTLHVIYNGYVETAEIWYRSRTSAGVWSSAERITTSSSSHGQAFPTIAVDSTNRVYIVWGGQGYGSYPAAMQVVLRYKEYGSSWASVELVTDMGSGGGAWYGQICPTIAVDTTDKLHIAWYDAYGSTVYYRTRTSAGAYSAIDTIGSGGPVDIALDSSNYPHLAFSGQYRFKTAGGWQTVESTGVPSRTIISLDTSNVVTIVGTASGVGVNTGSTNLIKSTRTGGVWPSPTVIIDRTSNQLVPAIFWSNYPRVGSTILGVPSTGYAVLYLQTGDTKVGFLKSSDFYFTTIPAVAPVIGTSAAADVQGTTAVLKGIVTDDGEGAVEFRFVYDTNSGDPYASSTSWSGVDTKLTGSVFSTLLDPINSSQIYYFKAQGRNSQGTIINGSELFFTSGKSPVIETLAASSVVDTTAVLNAQVTSNGSASCQGQFEYGTTAGGPYTVTTAWQTGLTTGSVINQSITGLTAGTIYYFRAVIDNTYYKSYGAEKYFVTTGGTATFVVTTGSAADITTTSATLQGVLVTNTGNSTTYVRFEWGTSESYGHTTAWKGPTTVGESFSSVLTGLTEGSTYVYRAQAQHSDGIPVSGAATLFTTSVSIPNVPTSFSSRGTGTSIVLTWVKGSGSVNTMVRYSTTSTPVSVDDGTSVYFGSASTYTLSGLTAGTTYYFSAWGENNGVYSVSKVSTSSQPTVGALADPDILTIEDVKVFKDYSQTGDQLYVISYKIVYTAGNPAQDSEDYFNIDLWDGDLLLARTKAPHWGFYPASIYLYSSTVPTWGLDYTVKITGIDSKWTVAPETTYALASGDWVGPDLTDLDYWVINHAQSLENYYNTDLTIYTTGYGTKLNQAGGEIYRDAIPGLSVVRPDIFSIVAVDISSDSIDPEGLPTQGQDDLTGNFGATVMSKFDDLGAFMGLSGTAVAGLFWFVVMVIVAGSVSLLSGTPVVGLLVCLPILFIGAYLGVIPLAIVATLGIIGLVLLISSWILARS